MERTGEVVVYGVQLQVHIFVVSEAEESLQNLHAALQLLGLSQSNPPFLIYIDEPRAVANTWKSLFCQDFWMGDYLGYHWKYKPDDLDRCFGKVMSDRSVLHLPTQHGMQVTDNLYTNQSFALNPYSLSGGY
jgi:hypothetical protein